MDGTIRKRFSEKKFDLKLKQTATIRAFFLESEIIGEKIRCSILSQWVKPITEHNLNSQSLEKLGLAFGFWIFRIFSVWPGWFSKNLS